MFREQVSPRPHSNHRTLAWAELRQAFCQERYKALRHKRKAFSILQSVLWITTRTRRGAIIKFSDQNKRYRKTWELSSKLSNLNVSLIMIHFLKSWRMTHKSSVSGNSLESKLILVRNWDQHIIADKAWINRLNQNWRLIGIKTKAQAALSATLQPSRGKWVAQHNN